MADPDLRSSLKAGDLTQARKVAVDAVRGDPGNPAFRSSLFQVSVVLGEWDRALSQLSVLRELQPDSLDLISDYEAAIEAERQREQVVAGKMSPSILGEPDTWVAKLVEALRCDADGATAAAHALRSEAFDEAATIGGAINQEDFAWVGDADQRFGPVLEAVFNGEYHWIPFTAISVLDLEPPRDLRDLVWTVGVATFSHGGSWPLLLPVRYPGSEVDASHALARRTDWRTLHGEHCAGQGQKLFVTDTGDYPLLEVRRLSLAQPEPDADGDTDHV